MSESSLPAVANEDSGISVNGVDTSTGGGGDATLSRTTSGHSATVKRTVVTTEGIQIPTVTTRINVDTTKMSDLCERLDGSLMQMVDDTREDDLFVTRLQEEFLQADEKWEEKVSGIADEFLSSKKAQVEETSDQELSRLKEELASLRNREAAAQTEKEDLHFKLRMKRVKTEQLADEMNKLNDQLKDEEGWSKAVQRQLEAIRKDNVDTFNKDRFEAIAKVSNDLIKFRNKRVPDAGELQHIHELVDRVHHSLGYLMELGQHLPTADDANPEANNDSTSRKPSVSSAL